MLTFDLYWSFRSPYSYFVARRLRTLEHDFEVRCNVRPIFPIAVRTPEFFESRDPLWFTYFQIDCRREAAFLGLPFRWARPDPVFRLPDGSYPKEQPHIHRLTYLGVAAAERGRGLPFLDEVSTLIWGGAVDDWHLGDHLRQAASRAGLDYDELSAAVDGDPERYRAIVEESQVAQRGGGHYGVPLMVFDGEPFFGQDRFDQLRWRLELKGLKRRAPA
ncbi:DsbA family protein [Parvibaculum sp.]|uniref:2-hydroxychromene-2-carboxylate isomerase n=1 Tax=Parvibaculum sp. TaxID=2024848 RepID=UPI001B04962B|nr:DsbA family protein [Parvibaculum sp.]MBO6714484.1 DsbA family protein [Parvibaculum sp.]MBO6734654.1 DsbA family protein [Roseitalea sp.]MCK5911104.1 DsbA family protein [Caulobacter sp.]